MTDREAFDEVAAAYLPEHVTVRVKAGLFYSLVHAALAVKLREQPTGSSVGLIEIGHAAWRQLTPIEQAHTLDTLFTAYIRRVIDEDRERQLSAAAADDTKTYLEPDDLPLLAECLSYVEVIDDGTQLEGVPASSLHNVLSEIDLLRHRLAMTKRDDT
ncbi:hypothetical protein [Streptomyces mirabilis]|uniref:hypothetical protein n=1 Tax=Streptomyces mirabilis TaxID=68239 RepID=UPI0036DE15F3